MDPRESMELLHHVVCELVSKYFTLGHIECLLNAPTTRKVIHFFRICFMCGHCMTSRIHNQTHPSNSFTLFSQAYLDQRVECYKNIITINTIPSGPLGELVTRVRMPPLSEFKTPGPCCPPVTCTLSLRSFHGHGLMTIEELPELFSFLSSYNYDINTRLTKILKREESGPRDTIAFVTYMPL